MTDYSYQTLLDIKEDLKKYVNYAEKTKKLFNKNIEILKKDTNYYDIISINFKIFINGVPKICESIINDINLILSEISDTSASKKSITLLKNLYFITKEQEEFSWQSYKEPVNDKCKKYGYDNFKIVEMLYCEGRDFFISFSDVSNMISRISMYLETDTKVENNININAKNIKKSNIANQQTNNQTKCVEVNTQFDTKKRSLFSKIFKKNK